jgi:hypothetical protein
MDIIETLLPFLFFDPQILTEAQKENALNPSFRGSFRGSTVFLCYNTDLNRTLVQRSPYWTIL